MKAAAYARYSTYRQTENSIAYQLEKIQQYCKDNDISISAYYTDEAQSGTNIDRDGFRNLVSAARRNEFDAVVIYDISRGSRDVGDWFNFRKEMMHLGIRIISATQTLGDITNPNDFLTELISVGLGQHAVLDTRKKSIDGVAVRAKEGVFLGGTPPLGYDIVDQQYVINPTEAQHVKTIFQMYAAGKSYNTILAALDGARGKKGKPLGKNSLNSILKNERYIGVYTWNKRHVKFMRNWAGGRPNADCVRLEGRTPRIIDNETWERVQTRMKDNARRASNKAKREYLLSGKIKCEKCGATYIGHTSTNKKGYEHTRYICGNKYRTRSCDAKNISADEIEVFVNYQVQEYLLDMDFKAVAKEIADRFNSAVPDCSKEKAEVRKLTEQINNGMRAILSGLDFPELEDELTRLRCRKSELEDIIKAASNGKKTIEAAKVEKMLNEFVDMWDSGRKKEVIQMMIPEIYAHEDGTFTVNIGVHINGCGGRI